MVIIESINTRLLQPLAKKYIWWKTSEDALQTPQRIVAQVMDIGDYDDVQMISHELGENYLATVLKTAEVGQFSPRSWAYWHYRLGLAATEQTPPLPQRNVE